MVCHSYSCVDAIDMNAERVDVCITSLNGRTNEHGSMHGMCCHAWLVVEMARRGEERSDEPARSLRVWMNGLHRCSNST